MSLITSPELLTLIEVGQWTTQQLLGTSLWRTQKRSPLVTSTPLKFDSDEVTHKDMDGLAAPLTAEHNSQNPSTISSSNTTLANLASEFRKMREPKLQKLKGGNTSSAHLFLTGWVKEVRATIKDRELSESKGVQLIREFTESKACQQVDFFMDLNPIPTIEGVLDHLTAAFSTGRMNLQLSRNSTPVNSYPGKPRMITRRYYNSWPGKF